MMLDYHIHTTFSPDSHMMMREGAIQALRHGVSEIAFTDHVEWVPGDGATGYFRPVAYFEELERWRRTYAGRLSILAAMEMGSPHRFPAEAERLAAAHPWDYILGSVHWVPRSDGSLVRSWHREGFGEGMEAAYAAYFRELVSLAEGGVYDCLAHFDLVRRNSWAIFGRTLPLKPYWEWIEAALRAVIERGKGLEINTSALRRGMPTPLPSPEILRRYRELGGEIVTVGSDAHRVADVGADVRAGMRYAAEAGFRYIARFRHRRVVEWVATELR